MRLVFAGTPSFAARILDALLATDHEVVCVYTQPDRPAGRGRKLRESEVKRLARKSGIPVRQPQSLKPDAERASLAGVGADLMVVAAYGLLLPQTILDTPAFGCINVHASLLPRWRGAAPIQRAIIAGDRKTGVSIMQMDAGLDTGDVLRAASCAIGDDDTAGELEQKLAGLGARTLVGVLAEFERDGLRPVPQNDADATYAPRIKKHEARLDWNLNAHALARRVRAFNPWPIAFTRFRGGAADARLRIWAATATDETPAGATPGTVLDAGPEGIRVAAGEGALTIERIQVPGSRAMSSAEFLNARKIRPGTRFGGD